MKFISYGKDCFTFSDNFLRMTFPAADQVTDQVTDQVRSLIKALESEPKGVVELMSTLNLKHRPPFRINYINSAIELKLIEMTISDKPNSRLQKYRLTKKGMTLKQSQ